MSHDSHEQSSKSQHGEISELLIIMREQRDFLARQTTALEMHFGTTATSLPSSPGSPLIKSNGLNAWKTQAASETKPSWSGAVVPPRWDDDVGWSMVLQTALKKIKEQVDFWKESLDNTLLFITLFSAIVTAFLLSNLTALEAAPDQHNDQLLQNLINLIAQIASLNGLKTPTITPPDPFAPATSDEVSAALWYSSLIISILCAGLATFSRFQMMDIQGKPRGRGFLEKVIRLKDREQLAQRLITPTSDVINWSIVVSIALFIAGLLYQLWNLHALIVAPVILAAGIIGTALTGLVVVFVAGVSIHAILYEESPFETSFSRLLGRTVWCIMGGLRDLRRWRPSIRPPFTYSKKVTDKEGPAPECHSISEFSWTKLSRALFSPHFCVAKHEASLYFFELVSQCDDGKLLEHSTPVMVEHFDSVELASDEYKMHVARAIIRVLDTDVGDDTKLFLLQNIMRIDKNIFARKEPKSGYLIKTIARILLRVQEAGADKGHEICKAAFHALVFLTDKLEPKPEPPAEASDIEPLDNRRVRRGMPISDAEFVVRGLGSYNPLKSGNVPKAFLGALLEFSHMSWEARQEVLNHKQLPLSTFLSSYVSAIYWANAELGEWDHRARYRRILTDAVRPTLDGIIGSYSKDNLLFELKGLIEGLGGWIEKSKPAERHKRACAACMGILRRLRVSNKLPKTGLKPIVDFGPLAHIFPSVALNNAEDTSTNETISKGITRRADLVTLRHVEALVFFIDEYAEYTTSSGSDGAKATESDTGSSIFRFLIQCQALVVALLKDQDPQPIQTDVMPTAPPQSSQDSDDLRNIVSDKFLESELTEQETKEARNLLENIQVRLSCSEGTYIKYFREHRHLQSWETDPLNAPSKSDDGKSSDSENIDEKDKGNKKSGMGDDEGFVIQAFRMIRQLSFGPRRNDSYGSGSQA
ncbi:hypothetical protein SISNIDRAFT_487404 [Sistotremastrum niveocremeum HHB9708]|uniref:DUF6535 domain-containing protein n=1 Tax=Sistotremastrum niveocremeum HHB9708 TaxID=1314777 RepID=A0A164SF63_9AGAM|nr:hypothetical protein SISNIDRAFT_487404 [Sistotremastrum niveocremeum HHB9708]